MNTNALIEIILKTIRIRARNNMRLTFDKLELSYLVSFVGLISDDGFQIY